MANTITDPEFGTVAIRRVRKARYVKLKIDHRGAISISMPYRAPLFFAKNLLGESREHIRQNLASLRQNQIVLMPGDIIGKTHRLELTTGEAFAARVKSTALLVTVPEHASVESPEVQQYIKEASTKALRIQAKAYLPRRLEAFSDAHGFSFAQIRFSNAGTRWGSCSSRGTISLNIWLMHLPFELIDYVLVHELCHTKQMNHSQRFWQLVEGILPNYRDLRRALKEQRPYA
ncbi:MAG: M48 family metallopeptidase [Candidatus Saccharimonadales bacterium]